MTRRGWNGIRRAWRHCRWAGCFEPEVAPWQQICAYHINEHDRLEADFKQRQLPLPFWFLLAKPAAELPITSEPEQLEIVIPHPRLRGSRRPEYYAKEQTYEEIRAEILRDIWNEKKDEYQKRTTPKVSKRRVRNGVSRDHDLGRAV